MLPFRLDPILLLHINVKEQPKRDRKGCDEEKKYYV